MVALSKWLPCCDPFVISRSGCVHCCSYIGQLFEPREIYSHSYWQEFCPSRKNLFSVSKSHQCSFDHAQVNIVCDCFACLPASFRILFSAAACTGLHFCLYPRVSYLLFLSVIHHVTVLFLRPHDNHHNYAFLCWIFFTQATHKVYRIPCFTANSFTLLSTWRCLLGILVIISLTLNLGSALNRQKR